MWMELNSRFFVPIMPFCNSNLYKTWDIRTLVWPPSWGGLVSNREYNNTAEVRILLHAARPAQPRPAIRRTLRGQQYTSNMQDPAKGEMDTFIINPLFHVDISLSLVYCVILSHHHSHVNMLGEGRAWRLLTVLLVIIATLLHTSCALLTVNIISFIIWPRNSRGSHMPKGLTEGLNEWVCYTALNLYRQPRVAGHRRHC